MSKTCHKTNPKKHFSKIRYGLPRKAYALSAMTTQAKSFKFTKSKNSLKDRIYKVLDIFASVKFKQVLHLLANAYVKYRKFQLFGYAK